MIKNLICDSYLNGNIINQSQFKCDTDAGCFQSQSSAVTCQRDTGIQNNALPTIIIIYANSGSQCPVGCSTGTFPNNCV